MSAIVDRSDAETKEKFYNVHLVMGNEDEMDLEDIEVAGLLRDVLESWLQEYRSILQE